MYVRLSTVCRNKEGSCVFLPPVRHSEWLLSSEEFRQVVAPRVTGVDVDVVMFCFERLAPRYRAQLQQHARSSVDISS